MKKMYFILLLLSSFSFGQKKEGQALIDSLLVELPKKKEDTLKINLLNDLAFEYSQGNPKKCLEIATQALQLSKKLNYTEGLVASYRNQGIFYSYSANDKKAIQLYTLGLKAAKTKKQKAKMYNALGVQYIMISNLPLSLDYYLKSLKIYEEIKDNYNSSILILNIGNIYLQLEQYEKALLYYNKIITSDKKQNPDAYKSALCNSGFANAELKKDSLALKFYIKTINLINPDLNLDINLRAYCYKGIGSIYLNKKEYDKALFYFFEIEKLNEKFKDDGLFSENKGAIAKVYFEKAKTSKKKEKINYLTKAKTYLEEGIQVSSKINNLNNLTYQYKLLFEVQKMQGDTKNAIVSLEKSMLYKDSVFNSDNKETIKNLEDKREIELRDKEIKINKLSLDANQKQKWFYILGLGFLATLGGLLFYQSRNRQKTNQKLQVLNTELDQANKTKTRFFSILNHDLRSPVANLIHFLHLQKDNPELLDEATKTRMQDKTITGAENLLSSMEDILLWSKGQMENFKPQPKQIAINQLFDDTKKVFSGYLKISFEYNNPENLEVFTDENYLKTIIRNLTSNAINVFTTTENPTIIWKAYQSENKTFLSITDNGPGATQEQFKALYDDTEVVGIKTGLGLHLIRDLAKAIDCEISVDSKVNEGTTFTLKI